MNPFVLEILGSVIRSGATLLTGYLVTHHFLMADDGDKFATELTTHVMLLLPALGALAWSIYQKYAKNSKLGAALDTVAAMQSVQQKVGQ